MEFLQLQLNALKNEKKQKQIDLSKINDQMDIVKKQLQSCCPHTHIDKEMDFDGHKNNIYHFCRVCEKPMNGFK